MNRNDPRMSGQDRAGMATRQGGSSECEPVDWLPFAGGAALVLLVLTNRSKLLGLGALVGGGYLLMRGIENGTIRVPPELMDQVKSQVDEIGRSVGLSSSTYDVDEASEESFPASDPPSRY